MEILVYNSCVDYEVLLTIPLAMCFMHMYKCVESNAA